jgi:polyhydroxyalkanoate synthase subunit PhaC
MSPSVLDPRRSLEQRRQAVANLFDFLLKGGLADDRRMPSDVIDEGRKRTLHRYRPLDGVGRDGNPVLLVPPLGAQATCMDLRRGCSLAEHLLTRGRPTYLIDYGSMGFADRDLGLEHWVGEVVPKAVAKASNDAGGAEVALVGWCMGGLMSLGTVAAHEQLPVNAVAMVASPFDMSKNPMLAPVRTIGAVTRGSVASGAVRVMGGVPAWLVGPAFKATSIPTYIKKPITLWNRRDDRDFLAQVEAVDRLMNHMLTYPGRATLQAYQKLAIRNELATGRIEGPNRVIELADVRTPVMNIAGTSDVIVPVAVAHHVGELLPNASEVRLETAPGGHLGVLTGRAAAATTWALIDDFLDTHAT